MFALLAVAALAGEQPRCDASGVLAMAEESASISEDCLESIARDAVESIELVALLSENPWVHPELGAEVAGRLLQEAWSEELEWDLMRLRGWSSYVLWTEALEAALDDRHFLVTGEGRELLMERADDRRETAEAHVKAWLVLACETGQPTREAHRLYASLTGERSRWCRSF